LTSIEDIYAIYRQHPVICTDTRHLSPGCLFFALKGDSFDGNQFAARALKSAAAYAVVDNNALVGEKFIHVENTLETLQQLAAHHRRQFDIPILAIGGSNGKTTTKELVSAVLSSHYPCHFTRGNLNNHIGVPLTLLAMPDNTEVAVIEMGTNQAGDIDLLCAIAAPTHGLLTNIGKEHLEGFGNLEGVKKAEGELFRYLARHHGCVFVNHSEHYLKNMARSNKYQVGYQRTDILQAHDGMLDVQLVEETPFIRAAFLSDAGPVVEVQTQLIGLHNFSNIMTAMALGTYFKVPAEKIKTALESYMPSNNRSQLIRRGTNTILLDAYNANPSSMKPALRSLQSLPAAHKVAILGDMLELGVDSLQEHEAILRFVMRMKFDQIVLVGQEFSRTSYKKYGALYFPTAADAKQWFDNQHFEGTAILLKGSRGIRLENII